MIKDKCSYTGCVKDAFSRTVCGQHYMVLKREDNLPKLINENHRLSYSAEYKAWANMISRCHRPSYRSYYRYGGRGIKVCDKWRYSFTNFHSDMGNRPSTEHSVDRINIDDDYNPENCKWATRKQQARNTSKNHHITYKGETFSVSEWAERLQMNRNTIQSRMRYGWSMERIVNTSVRNNVV